MRPAAMSKRADALTIRLARPEERDDLEALQRRASLANENDRPHLEAHPDAIHLPPAQIANGQVYVAELDGRVAGFVAVVGGVLDGLVVEPGLGRGGMGAALVAGATLSGLRRWVALRVGGNRAAGGCYE